jgi:hypothetical protein
MGEVKSIVNEVESAGPKSTTDSFTDTNDLFETPASTVTSGDSSDQKDGDTQLTFDLPTPPTPPVAPDVPATVGDEKVSLPSSSTESGDSGSTTIAESGERVSGLGALGFAVAGVLVFGAAALAIRRKVQQSSLEGGKKGAPAITSVAGAGFGDVDDSVNATSSSVEEERA